MADYKDSLNLPRTDFPMKANLAQKESGFLKKWSEIDLYKKRSEKNQSKKYILHDGPPYANGNIHLGHAVNKILKDIVNRFKFLEAFNTPFIPGWDCHGLPIEINVEKKIGRAGQKVTANAFREACRKYAQSQVDQQKKDFMRLGVLANWDHPYLSMDPKFEAHTIRALKKIYENGYLFSAEKPIHWCFNCASALAEAEIEYQEKSSNAIDVKFKIIKFNPPKKPSKNLPYFNLSSLASKGEVFFLIWTTTPWTLPANTAVAYSDEGIYTVLESQLDEKKEYLILAKNLVEHFHSRTSKKYALATFEDKPIEILGSYLYGMVLAHPFYTHRSIPVVPSLHVTTDSGTGLVHIAPAYGEEDYKVWFNEKFAFDKDPATAMLIYHYVNGYGLFTAEAEGLKGDTLAQAEEKIIAWLKEKNRLVHEANFTHSYPHCWRHKTPIIFRATPQWFINLTEPSKKLLEKYYDYRSRKINDTIEQDRKRYENAPSSPPPEERHEILPFYPLGISTRWTGATLPPPETLEQRACQAIQNVKWIPDWGQERLKNMLEGPLTPHCGEIRRIRPPWCISRQRTWGVPIPFFIHKETRELHPKTSDILERIANEVEKKGAAFWFDSKAEDWIGEEADQYEKSNDILDVWFDSGVTHYAVLKEKYDSAWRDLEYPADLYLEGSDQYRGWFQTSLLTSGAISLYPLPAPYKTVVTHGFTVDSEGRKMSKSLGNVIEPQKIIDQYGADILRLWVASSDFRAEMSLSNEILQRTVDCYRRIRNTARYLLSNLFDFDPLETKIEANELLALDQFLLTQANRLQIELIEHYDQFNFHIVVQKIHHFCTVNLGGFYLDLIKDRQYTLPKTSLPRRSAQTTLFYILEMLVRWLAPILPFTAEEIWQYKPGDKADSVHLVTWFNPPLPHEKKLSDEDWNGLLRIREAVNKQLEIQRQAGVIGSPLEAEIILFAKKEVKHLLDSLKCELRFILLTSSVEVYDMLEKTSSAVLSEMEGLAVEIKASLHQKCGRCWHRSADIGQNEKFPDICLRCIKNISTPQGETRYYA